MGVVRQDVHEHRQQVQETRCGSHGLQHVQKGAILLQLEQTGHRSLRSGLAVSGCQLGRLAVPIPVPAIQSYRSMFEQNKTTKGGRDCNNFAVLARQAMVQSDDGNDGRHQEIANIQDSSGGHDNRGPSSRHQVVQVGRLSSFWNKDQGGLSAGAKQLVEASWRPATEAQYSSCWRKWTVWTGLHGISSTAPALNDVLNYLSELYNEGLQYRTINTARSTLSSTLPPMDGFPVGQHPLVTRLMKGIFNSRPIVKTLFPAWSVKLVLKTLREWSPASKLSLKLLTLKTVMLLALATGKRASSIKLLSIKSGYIEVSEGKVVLQPFGLEKHSRLDRSFPPITIESYNEDPSLCPVFYIKTYLRRTSSLRSSDSLFVTTTKPHDAATIWTILRWLKTVISQSGQQGSGGSVRSVTTSTAVGTGVTMEKILKAGDWSRATTFRNFYYKPVPINHLQHMLSTL